MKNKEEELKHHAEKYGISLKQFKTMCNNASKHYENQGMNSVDYGLAREAYFAGFTDACKEALEQPAWKGLTDDEIGNLITPYEYSVHPDLDGFARAIEQTLKEKNT